MKSLSGARLPGQLLLLSVLIALLGLSPRAHLAGRDLSHAQRLAQAGSFGKAAAYLASAAGRLPARPDLWELAGRYALQGGDPQAAIAYLRRAAGPGFLDPASPVNQADNAVPGALTAQGCLDLGDAYLQAGDLPAAIRSWQAALAAGSPPAGTYRRIYPAQRSLGDYPAAIAALSALAALDPSDPGLHYQLGLLVAAQQPEAALAHLSQAAELDAALAGPVAALRRAVLGALPAADQAYSLLAAGRTLASLDEWELAAEAFRQASLARPDYAEAWAYLGEARQHLQPAPQGGQPDSQAGQPPSPLAGSQAGFAELQTALRLDPNSLSSRTFIALYWARRGRHDLALEALQAAARLDPKNPLLHAQVGEALATLGDLQAALQSYRRAVALAPRDSAVHRLLASFSLKYDFQVGEIALPAARQAVVLAPNQPANLDLMGQVFIQLNDLRSAERFLHRAVQADGGFAPAHLHLGSLYIMLEEHSRARQEFILARSLDPHGPVAQQSESFLQNYFP